MKFLQDDGLQQLTAALTHAAPSQSRRVDGRLEAFTMKRTSTEKREAHRLGERFVTELSQQEDDAAAEAMKRQRAHSVGDVDLLLSDQTEAQRPTKRPRSSSLDSNATSGSRNSIRVPAPVPLYADSTSALGDMVDLGARRLFTDLILTLNACFPDYDFGNVRPAHFRKWSMKDAMKRVNGCLSELSLQNPHLIHQLWAALDQCMPLRDTEVIELTGMDHPPEFWAALLTDTTQDDSTTADEDSSASSITPLWSFNYFFVNRPMKRVVLFSCVETMVHPDLVDETEEEAEFQVQTYKFSTSSAGKLNFDMDPASGESFPIMGSGI
uniref:Repressor of RNA polymerase III transcription n=1 Tax=Grammatophora oceanica TaxID=210454 RepID=A0A7S1UYP9_9STRA|mmetsp:Transcript_27103/g.39683  ORF Transcript_27103/g.39683 Transcript_27103/m.39683 type:complete len:325 (+) Transcript_27103:304-1278(+)|eukprot:CAMPEP_0194066576 /NCGR_PEP_ID=MMETSP0009_2-20130614/86099_1 /TAXON_ID=210454 /ORGANISM="Grammatophora oceanica, Strain CCMP 410" /LENGTH=324 /DNA_ID=CAMNT_0038719543 /DNA_START=245 /DNA_END=1219 /DNA_ORIENTATION=-